MAKMNPAVHLQCYCICFELFEGNSYATIFLYLQEFKGGQCSPLNTWNNRGGMKCPTPGSVKNYPISLLASEGKNLYFYPTKSFMQKLN